MVQGSSQVSVKHIMYSVCIIVYVCKHGLDTYVCVYVCMYVHTYTHTHVGIDVYTLDWPKFA